VQFWYFTYGTKDVLERECKDLHTKLKVYSHAPPLFANVYIWHQNYVTSSNEYV